MKKPAVNNVVKVLFLISGVMWIYICLWSLRDAYFPTESILQKHPPSSDGFYAFNKVLALVSTFIGTVLFLLAKKLNRPYGSKKLWYVVMLIHLVVLIHPIALLVFVFWCSKKNRAYHFGSAGELADGTIATP